jgi:DNA-binding NarL/FixJ family response regulator
MLAQSAELLERDVELAALGAAVADAAAGRERLVLVEGPSGIGKTRLLAHARQMAVEAGLVPLVARGGELEQQFPFGAVRQLFEPRLADPAARARLLAEPASGARRIFEPVADAGGLREGDPSFAVLHSLFWLVVNLSAEGPLFIAVDDLHWCDAPSLRALAYLVRRLEGLPVLLVGSLRPSEPGVDRALLSEIAADPLCVSLGPGPLGEDAVARLVRARLGEEADPAFAAACRTATGGNPLLLGELLKSFGNEGVRPKGANVGMVAALGPRAASRAILVRLARMPREAVAIARAAATLGDGALLSTVLALAEVEDGDVAGGLEALARGEILRLGSSVEFVHPLLGAAVAEELTPVDRAGMHRRAAELLSAAGAPLEQVAAQLLQSLPGGEPWVADVLLRAGRAALRAGGPDSAVALLARALAEPPSPDRRTEVLLELGHAEALTFGPDAALHLTEAHAALDDPLARAELGRALARTLLLTGRPDAAEAIVRRSAAELPPGEHRDAFEAFEVMAVYFGSGDPAKLERLSARLGRRPAPNGVVGDILAAVTARQRSFAGASSEACAALARDALAGGKLIAADHAFFGVVAIATLARADRPEALEVCEAALAEAHRAGSLLAKCCVSWILGFTLLRRGDLIAAEAALRTAVEEFRLWGLGPEPGEIDCAALLAAALGEQGKVAEARCELERFADPGTRSDSARFWLHARLGLLLADRRFDEALALARECDRRFACLPNPIDTPWRSAQALALDGLGERDAALEAAEEGLELARRWGSPGVLAHALRILGTVERGAGLDRLREAVEAAAGSPARLEHTKALAALGGALRRARLLTEARAALRQAAEQAAGCGAEGLRADVHAELRAAGARPRGTALSGVGALTPSERRVAALAADGAANRDIAQALFVTPKTVELHLSNSYRKLGIASRRDLPEALGPDRTWPSS